MAGSAVLLSDGTYQGQGVAQFTGEVAGCGQGTLLMLEVGILDPATGTDAGTWTIVAGRGRRIGRLDHRIHRHDPLRLTQTLSLGHGTGGAGRWRCG